VLTCPLNDPSPTASRTYPVRPPASKALEPPSKSNMSAVVRLVGNAVTIWEGATPLQAETEQGTQVPPGAREAMPFP
jgi:hypothetical protein